jgi:hypothetical protein
MSAAEERAAVLAWLEKQAKASRERVRRYQAEGNYGPYLGEPKHIGFSDALAAIQRGEHREEG